MPPRMRYGLLMKWPKLTQRKIARMLRPVAAVALLAPLVPLSSRAADPQPYTVNVQETGQAPLDAALMGSSTLINLREKAPAGPFALVARARNDKERLQSALGSFGYYDGKVAITIDGQDIDDPKLPDRLEAAKGPVPIKIGVAKGPQFTIGSITLNGESGPGALDQARSVLKLKSGDPAQAAEIVAAQGRMLTKLRDDGYALAKVGTPDATLLPSENKLDIAYTVEAGPRVDLGPIAIDGLDRVNESYVRRVLTIHQGERFDPRLIEEARQNLAQLGVFGTVRARAAEQLNPQGQIPITIDVTERPRRAVGITASYSTDLGASAGVTWQHRNLFGNAETLKLGAAVTQLGGSATQGIGYDVTAALTFPDIFARNQSLTISLEAVKENLDAYDRRAYLAGVTLTRKLSEQWTVNGGLLAEQARITQEGVTTDYTLIGVPLGAKYDTTGPEGLLNPTHGVKVFLTAVPTAAIQTGSNYVILQAIASTYLNFADEEGRSVLALRGNLGSIQGASTFQIPPDQRLYAGGSATVRGYKYQYVGPKFPVSGRPTGGTSLAAAQVEYRQRFGGSYGAAVFVDAGQVSDGSNPFSGDLRVGAGVGARYYTSFGPLRIDVAVPLNTVRGNDSFQLYLGIGQTF